MKMSLVLPISLIFAVGFPAAAFPQAETSSAGHRSGREIFVHKCETCHGSDGAGTPIGKNLKVADLRSALIQKKSDAELSRIVSGGKNSMPAFDNDLSPDEIKLVISYVRTLKAKKK
jgi:mono/diheme cytochrome c family protein